MACCNSTIVNAPVENVWARLRDFHDLSWSPNVITKVDKVGSLPGTQIGAKRVLNQAFHETLLALDDAAHVIRYSIDDGPDAVSKKNVQGYIGEVRLFPVTDVNSTLVLWTSRWDSSGGGVSEFCDPIYRALLADLKKTFA
jgi:hypothetical protein